MNMQCVDICPENSYKCNSSDNNKNVICYCTTKLDSGYYYYNDSVID